MLPMYIVKITNGQFAITGSVKADDAIGPDTCTRF
jgi:branched-chain amino acid transport system substrate-binding protein